MEAAQKELAARWDAEQQQLLEWHLRSSLEASKDGAVMIEMALDADGDATMSCQITEENIDHVLRQVARAEGMAGQIMQAEKAKMRNKGNAGQQQAQSEKLGVQDGGTTSNTRIGITHEQLRLMRDVSVDQKDVVANAIERELCLKVLGRSDEEMLEEGVPGYAIKSLKEQGYEYIGNMNDAVIEKLGLSQEGYFQYAYLKVEDADGHSVVVTAFVDEDGNDWYGVPLEPFTGVFERPMVYYGTTRPVLAPSLIPVFKPTGKTQVGWTFHSTPEGALKQITDSGLCT